MEAEKIYYMLAKGYNFLRRHLIDLNIIRFLILLGIYNKSGVQIIFT